MAKVKIRPGSHKNFQTKETGSGGTAAKVGGKQQSKDDADIDRISGNITIGVVCAGGIGAWYIVIGFLAASQFGIWAGMPAAIGAIVMVCSFFVFKRSRVAALLMFCPVVIAWIMMFLGQVPAYSASPLGILVSLGITYGLWRGVDGTFEYHRYMKAQVNRSRTDSLSQQSIEEVFD